MHCQLNLMPKCHNNILKGKQTSQFTELTGLYVSEDFVTG